MYRYLKSLFWPISNIYDIIYTDKQVTTSILPLNHFSIFIQSMNQSIKAFILAYLCIYCISSPYPAFDTILDYDYSWISPILYRNLIGTWVICGFWDWFLYFSPYAEKIKKYKIVPAYPNKYQFVHDFFMTTISTVIGTCFEIVLCYMWSNNIIEYQKNMFDTPIVNILWILSLSYWRHVHFYVIHRLMHPWNIKYDFGKFLYINVHYLHHQSDNPPAFSGTSMHPIESTLYYHENLTVYFKCHPIIVVACILDDGISAWLGHDGFVWPGSGDIFHTLHHQYRSCNYGTLNIPLDYLFGSFKDNPKII